MGNAPGKTVERGISSTTSGEVQFLYPLLGDISANSTLKEGATGLNNVTKHRQSSHDSAPLVHSFARFTAKDSDVLLDSLSGTQMTPKPSRIFSDLMQKRFLLLQTIREAVNSESKAEQSDDQDVLSKGSLPKAAEVGIRTGVRLMISLLRSQSRVDPEVREEALDFFLEILGELPPLSLWGGGSMSLLLDKSFHHIARFLNEIIHSKVDVPEDMKSKALKILFGLGLARGSLPNLLLVAEVLLVERPTFALPIASELLSLSRVHPWSLLTGFGGEDLLGCFLTECPRLLKQSEKKDKPGSSSRGGTSRRRRRRRSRSYSSDESEGSSDYDEEEEEEEEEDTDDEGEEEEEEKKKDDKAGFLGEDELGDVPITVAADGQYLYGHGRMGLVKIGTGYNGTVPGKVYARNKEYRPTESGWLACVGDKLYYRSPEIQPAAMEVLMCSTLALVCSVANTEPIVAEEEDGEVETKSGVTVAVEADKEEEEEVTSLGQMAVLFYERAASAKAKPASGEAAESAKREDAGSGSESEGSEGDDDEDVEEGESGSAASTKDEKFKIPAARSPLFTDNRYLYVLSQWKKVGAAEDAKGEEKDSSDSDEEEVSTRRDRRPSRRRGRGRGGRRGRRRDRSPSPARKKKEDKKKKRRKRKDGEDVDADFGIHVYDPLSPEFACIAVHPVFMEDVTAESLKDCVFTTNGKRVLMIRQSGYDASANMSREEFRCSISVKAMDLMTGKPIPYHSDLFTSGAEDIALEDVADMCSVVGLTSLSKAVAYDAFNNALWSASADARKIVGWSNRGLPPRWDSVSPVEEPAEASPSVDSIRCMDKDLSVRGVMAKLCSTLDSGSCQSSAAPGGFVSKKRLREESVMKLLGIADASKGTFKGTDGLVDPLEAAAVLLTAIQAQSRFYTPLSEVERKHQPIGLQECLRQPYCVALSQSSFQVLLRLLGHVIGNVEGGTKGLNLILLRALMHILRTNLQYFANSATDPSLLGLGSAESEMVEGLRSALAKVLDLSPGVEEMVQSVQDAALSVIADVWQFTEPSPERRSTLLFECFNGFDKLSGARVRLMCAYLQWFSIPSRAITLLSCLDLAKEVEDASGASDLLQSVQAKVGTAPLTRFLLELPKIVQQEGAASAVGHRSMELLKVLLAQLLAAASKITEYPTHPAMHYSMLLASKILTLSDSAIRKTVEGSDPEEVQSGLQRLPLWPVLPSLLVGLSAVCTTLVAAQSCATEATMLLKSLGSAVKKTGLPDAKEVVLRHLRSEVFESKHPERLHNASRSITFSGAAGILVTIDSLTSFPQKCILSVYKGSSSSGKPVMKIDGPDAVPEPVTVRGSSVTIKAQIRRRPKTPIWGYKVTAEEVDSLPAVEMDPLVDLYRMAGHLVGKSAALLVKDATCGEQVANEGKFAVFLESDLLSGGLRHAPQFSGCLFPAEWQDIMDSIDMDIPAAILDCDSADAVTEEEATTTTPTATARKRKRLTLPPPASPLLLDLVNYREDSPAVAFSSALHKRHCAVMLARLCGAEGRMLCAAVFAAMVWQGDLLEPLNSLVDLHAASGGGVPFSQDVLSELESHGSQWTLLSGLYSTATGMLQWLQTQKAQQTTARGKARAVREVKLRSRFLLAVKSAVRDGQMPAQAVLSGTAVPVTPPPSSDSMPPPMVPSLRRQFSDDQFSAGAMKWKGLLTTYQSAMKWRRLTKQSKEKAAGVASASAYDREEFPLGNSVLMFVQSTLSVRALHAHMLARSQRALGRAIGLRLFQRMLVESPLASARLDALAWLRAAFAGVVEDKPTLSHALDSLNGCGKMLLDAVRTEFHGLLRQLVSRLTTTAARVAELRRLLPKRKRKREKKPTSSSGEKEPVQASDAMELFEELMEVEETCDDIPWRGDFEVQQMDGEECKLELVQQEEKI